MRPASHPRTIRSRLLSGSAAASALLLAASPAAAQVSATGHMVVTGDQQSRGTILADTSGSRIEMLLGSLGQSTTAIDDDSVDAAAASNTAGLELEARQPIAASGEAPSLETEAGAVAARADRVIAARQQLGSGDVTAQSIGTAVRLKAGDAQDSIFLIRNDSVATRSSGNAATASLASSGSASTGVAIRQDSSSGSRALATTEGGLETIAGTLTGSQIDIRSNNVAALARSNRVQSTLEAEGALAGTAAGPGSTVTAAGAQLSASAALLSDQHAQGAAWARAGGVDGTAAFFVRAAEMQGSTLFVRDSSLAADAQANAASNRLAATATRFGGTGGPEDGRQQLSTAGLTNAQHADGASVGATTSGGAAVTIDRDVEASAVEVADTKVSAIATRNLASNQLTVRATSIDAPRVHSEFVADAEQARLSAALSLHNVQDYGSGPRSYAVVSPLEATITVGGALQGARLTARDNDSLAAVAGNDAANAMKVEASAVGGSVALHNRQQGSGHLSSFLGWATDPAGTGIEIRGPVRDSQVEVTGNRDAAAATANRASNRMDISAATLSGSGRPASAAFATASSMLSGDIVLASGQQLGGATTELPEIRAQADTRIGIETGAVTNSRLLIRDNVQQAQAMGNDAANGLVIKSATRPNGNSASVVLGSRQEAGAELLAHSVMTIAAPSSISGSALEIQGNSNASTATMNQAVNTLVDDSLAVGETNGTATARLNTTASGTTLLINGQQAKGSVEAYTRTPFEIGTLTLSDASRWSFSDNLANADAAANRAENSIQTSNPAGIGLASEQRNDAAVEASAAIVARQVTAPTAANKSHIDVAGNTVQALARGNAAENRISISPSASGIAPAAIVGGASLDAPIALRSHQTNSGAIQAAAQGLDRTVPLNQQSPVQSSRLSIIGNAATASAAANTVHNEIAARTGGPILNVQTNTGNVSAMVVGSGTSARLGPLASTSVMLSGNQIAATAFGNQASNVIGTMR